MTHPKVNTCCRSRVLITLGESLIGLLSHVEGDTRFSGLSFYAHHDYTNECVLMQINHKYFEINLCPG